MCVDRHGLGVPNTAKVPELCGRVTAGHARGDIPVASSAANISQDKSCVNHETACGSVVAEGAACTELRQEELTALETHASKILTASLALGAHVGKKNTI